MDTAGGDETTAVDADGSQLGIAAAFWQDGIPLGSVLRQERDRVESAGLIADDALSDADESAAPGRNGGQHDVAAGRPKAMHRPTAAVGARPRDGVGAAGNPPRPDDDQAI